MEYIIMAAALAIMVLVLFLMESTRCRKEEKRFIENLYKNHGKLPKKEYALERFVRMGSYFERHSAEAQLDDITWNDLNMDDIFKRMNYTFSASGEEYLYYKLRTLEQDEESLQHLEEVIGFFEEHADERVKIQLAARKLGYTGKYSLYDYLDNLETLGERSNRKHVIALLLFVVFFALLWVEFSLGIMGLVVLIIYNIIAYFKDKGEIDPYITSFSYIIRLMKVCAEVEKINIPPCQREWQEIKTALRGLSGLKRNSYWIMSPYRGNAAQISGNLVEMFAEYIRMVFHADLMKFNSMLRVVRSHVQDVDRLISVMGYLETAIAIGAFRCSLENGYCVPELARTDSASATENSHRKAEITESTVKSLNMQEGYHPLLTSPVKNSIVTNQGVLLTGSNASGKSTFLKTVALNAVLAQTIHTCTADSYRASFFRVYSSMSLRDNLDSGESYYIVEIKALKRILDARGDGVPILCFVDEVLRGTNTVERIAASTQILKSLGNTNILCFAATHDIELTELLKNEFSNYHFEEDVRDGDIHFNYKLLEGKATTRNAIRLLELLGYEKEIIKKASLQAETFIRTNQWQ